jgi:hypothetical protein
MSLRTALIEFEAPCEGARHLFELLAFERRSFSLPILRAWRKRGESALIAVVFIFGTPWFSYPAAVGAGLTSTRRLLPQGSMHFGSPVRPWQQPVQV